MEDNCYQDFGLEAAYLEGRQSSTFGRKSNAAPSHTEPFPIQLHWMLEQTEKAGLSTVVGWSPHGRAFAVRDRQRFVKDVLPIYFNQTKITSFQRQCSLYGFRRISKGPDSGCYYHPKFLRSSRIFARNIVRTKVKNEGPRKAAQPSTEPDLYAMPSLPDPTLINGGDLGPDMAMEDTALRRPSLSLPDHQLPFAARLLHMRRSPPPSLTVLTEAAAAPVSTRLTPPKVTKLTACSSSLTAPPQISMESSDPIWNRLMTKHLHQQQRRLSLERLLASTRKRASPSSSFLPSPELLNAAVPASAPASTTAIVPSGIPRWVLSGGSSSPSGSTRRMSAASSLLDDLFPGTTRIDTTRTMSHSFDVCPEEEELHKTLILLRRRSGLA